jgi:hypothetical protein
MLENFLPPRIYNQELELEKYWKLVINKEVVDLFFLNKVLGIHSFHLGNANLIQILDDRAKLYLTKITRNNTIDFLKTFAESLSHDDYTKFGFFLHLYKESQRIYPEMIAKKMSYSLIFQKMEVYTANLQSL